MYKTTFYTQKEIHMIHTNVSIDVTLFQKRKLLLLIKQIQVAD